MRQILVVDDEPQTRHALDFILLSGGYRTMVASNGREALECIHGLARSGRGMDLLITDILMPIVNGIELIEILRSEGDTLPVMAVTAFGTMDVMLDLLRLGVKDFRSKPFEPDELLTQVNRLFERLDQERSLEETTFERTQGQEYTFNHCLEHTVDDGVPLQAEGAETFKREPEQQLISGLHGNIRVSSCEGQVIITPRDDLRDGAVGDLRSLLQRLRGMEQASIRFDLRRVKVIDAASVSVLVLFAKIMLKQKLGCQLEISGANPHVRKVFGHAHMDAFFRFID